MSASKKGIETPMNRQNYVVSYYKAMGFGRASIGCMIGWVVRNFTTPKITRNSGVSGLHMSLKYSRLQFDSEEFHKMTRGRLEVVPAKAHVLRTGVRFPLPLPPLSVIGIQIAFIRQL